MFRKGILSSSRVLGAVPVPGGGSPPAAWAPRTFTDGATWFNNYDGTANGNYLLVSGSEKARCSHRALCCLDDTYALVTYPDEASKNTNVKLLSRSGTTMSIEDTISISTSYGNAGGPSLAWISDTQAVLTTQDNNNGNEPTARVITRSGTSISAGTPTDLTSSTNGSLYTDVVMLTNTLGVATWRDGSTLNRKVAAFTVSGTSIGSVGSVSTITDSNAARASITRLSETACAIACEGSGNSGLGITCYSVSGTTLTEENSEELTNSYRFVTPTIAFMDEVSGVYRCYVSSVSNQSGYYGRVTVVDIDPSSSYDVSFNSVYTLTTDWGSQRYSCPLIASTDEYALIQTRDQSTDDFRMNLTKFSGTSRTSDFEELVVASNGQSIDYSWKAIDFFNDDYVLYLSNDRNTSLSNRLETYVICMHHGA